MYLSESFRFNQAIADMATRLTAIAGNDVPVVGHGTETELSSKAILVRNNSTLLDVLLEAHKKGEKVHVLADLTDLWSKVYHISALYFKQVPRYANKGLKQYRNYADLMAAADSLPELKKLIKATIKLSDGGLTANINNIKSIIVDEASADFTVSTIHKSKGLEWSYVVIADDILYQKEEQTLVEALLDNQTLNLIYVAVTRAKVKVVVPDDVMDVLNGWESLREDWWR
jgi:superfamily I DNA/RNA helicase